MDKKQRMLSMLVALGVPYMAIDKFKPKAQDETKADNRIWLEGPILTPDDQWIAEWLEMPYIGAKMVQEQMDKIDGDIEIYINSPGGSAFEGFEIVNKIELLKKDGIKVTTANVGLAASAAALVAVVGTERLMATASMLMFHKASMMVYGNSDELIEMADVMEKLDGRQVALLDKYSEGDEELVKEKDNFLDLDDALKLKPVDRELTDDVEVKGEPKNDDAVAEMLMKRKSAIVNGYHNMVAM